MALSVLSKAGITYTDRAKKTSDKTQSIATKLTLTTLVTPSICPLTMQQLADLKVTWAYIVANALAAFGTTIPMKAHMPKATIMAVYNKASYNTTILGGVANHICQVNCNNLPKMRPTTTTWTI
jgi:hypothetical protein